MLNALPLVEELTPAPELATVLPRLRHWPNLVLFDSSQAGGPTGRYSFLTADPFDFEVDEWAGGTEGPASGDPLARLEQRLREFPQARVPDLPPFQGGAAGLLAYDLHRAWERIPPPRRDEFELPALAVGLYDWVLAWDHFQQRAWIISQGIPEQEPARRADRARQRLQSVRAALQAPPVDAPSVNVGRLPVETLATAWKSEGFPGLFSNFSRTEYLRAVERAIEYIYAGDIFQVNLSQRLLYPQVTDPLALYLRLRNCNPAPFAGYFSHADWVVASASPERFLSVVDGEVETRPIKGTRRRRSLPEADLFAGDELRESEKDQAENVMIVDLLRNDLSRVCVPGSIRVPALCQVETYETVKHLVSEIRGRLQPGRTVWDLFRAAFPGGSITGAPKVRAMEIIAELEPTARGPYCGSLFYLGFDGTADSSILIRTFTIRRGWIQCCVGGGIVAQSDPAAEYEETWAKAEGMLRALR